MAAASSRSSLAGRPVKQVSESTRERETFKYEPSIYTTFPINTTGNRLPSSDLATSNDSVLTGLAQLGVYQTGTERALVSLFDTGHQYVIAEATQGLPLAPGLPSDQCPIPLTLCGTAVPRSHSVCEHMLDTCADDGKRDKDSRSTDAAELPLCLVRDVATDPRFRSRNPCCPPFGDGVFYAAVPIRTRRGIDIGSLCVLGSTKLDHWNDETTRRLADLSHAIMDHLEACRSKHSHRRSERMNRGLGSFIEGKATLSGWRTGPNVGAFENKRDVEGGLDSAQQTLEQEEQDEDEKQAEKHQKATMRTHGHIGPPSWSIVPPSRPDRRREAATARSPTRKTLGQNQATSTPETSSRPDATRNDIYSKAANIVRESFEVGGCLFYDVTMGSYRSHKPQMSASTPSKDAGVVGQSSTASVTGSSSSSGDEKSTAGHASHDSCGLLGYSTSDASSVNAVELSQGESPMPKKFLAKLLRRYPNGKIFNFDAAGELQTSDSSGDDDQALKETRDLPGKDGAASAGTQEKNSRGRYGRLREGMRIHETFPSARSVAFMPVWDSKKERWCAGAFMYTLNPSRVFTIEGDLSFFQAFTMTAATELHNLEALQEFKAKSDTLGSLSHELRSPLHGAILGTELLNDTDLTVFQGNAAHTIETCCRTLLDTIDHLLDFSKVNSLTANRKQQGPVAGRRPHVRPQRNASNDFGKTALCSNVELDRLVEEVVESLFAGHNFQQMSVRQLSMRHGAVKHTDNSANGQLDHAQAMEQLSPTVGGEGERRVLSEKVSVYVTKDPACGWMLRLPAGAVRRIVMNLFGNSLKYTTSGAIHVSLTQHAAPARSQRGVQQVKLVVQDTGKGISQDYLRHKLFKAFSQENELASGTGLGLGTVKAIVSQLQGQMSVDSHVGTGTTITVTLPLEQPSESPHEMDQVGDDHAKQVRELEGLRVRLMGFDSWMDINGGTDGRAMVEDICRHSLRLDLVPDESVSSMAPDLTLWSEEALTSDVVQMASHSKTPNVVICSDALVAYDRYLMYAKTGQDVIFEFLSQPIGARKLAKSIQLAYTRWMGLPKNALPPSLPLGLRRSVSLSGSKLLQEPKPTLPHRTMSSGPHAMVSSQTQTQTSDGEPNAACPQQGVSPDDAAAPSEEPRRASPEQHTSPDHILLVDDNHINLKVLAAYMGKMGRPYEAVTNGQEALDAYTQRPEQFAAILMDISMPVMDGLEATRLIRAHEHKNRLRAVSILTLTGLSSDGVHQEALESGVDVFLTKPVRFKALSEVLGSVDIVPRFEKENGLG